MDKPSEQNCGLVLYTNRLIYFIRNQGLILPATLGTDPWKKLNEGKQDLSSGAGPGIGEPKLAKLVMRTCSCGRLNTVNI